MDQLIALVAFIGLFETLILLLYAGRYYFFTLIASRTKDPPLANKTAIKTNNNHGDPFVSVLLPVYNEKNVIDRLMKFCTDFDYDSYEVIVADDSTDETTAILEKWKGNPKVKVIHRDTRSGWKEGALNNALNKVDPRSTHALILDADFVPPRNLLRCFLEKFDYDSVTVIQGYQVHDLNAEENWLTKAYKVMFSVSNMVELNAKKELQLILPITGSVYMIRTDVLKKMCFDECLTEDWDLTLRLYEAGYKVTYDSSLMASAECPNTLFKYFRQNMRWAEGHTRSALRQHFWKMLRSKALTRREKVDFLFQAGIYLNSILILASSIGGVWVLRTLGLTSALSSDYVILALLFAVVGFPAVSIAAIVALKSEGQKDFRHIPNMLLLGYISTPAVAYAAIRGLLTGKSYFHRTYKTGKVTDNTLREQLKKAGSNALKPFRK